MLHTQLGRFTTRDPLGYVDGMSVYAAYHLLHGESDSFGLKCGECDPGEYRILSHKTDKSLPGSKPGAAERAMADLRYLIETADRLHTTPGIEAGRAARFAKWWKQGVPRNFREYMPDALFKNPVSNPPMTPWDKLKGQVVPTVKRYLNRRYENHYNLWVVTTYQVCVCCCKDSDKGEWTKFQHKQKIVTRGPNISTHYSDKGRITPNPQDIKDTQQTIEAEIAKEARGEKCE
jgi:hypothetical protein